jgi:pyruvate dehydrogenase E2 component (dihydrolipoamide acetyltransferase)
MDASHIRGSGRNGRIRERDVTALAHAKPQAVPTPTRKAIAARMMESRQTTAPVTLTSQVDATNLVNLREQFKAADSVPVPAYTDFLLRFAAIALQQHPLLASQWTDAGIIPAKSIDIGIAVDTDAGLLVPVVRGVPALGLKEIAVQSRELIERARKGELSSREMQCGCFTITNLGAFGIDAFTPIINPPECAVLGVGRIERRPVMDGDRVVGRDLVTLSLTFDHRIVDGAPAARFLQTIAKCVENPAPWVSS